MHKSNPRRRLRATSLAGLVLSVAAATSVAVVASDAGADTGPGYVTSLASTPAQANVTPNTTALTGLVDGQPITLDFTATGAGNTLPRVEVRQCRGGASIASFTQFRPSTGGRCATDDPATSQFKLAGGVDSAGQEFADIPTDNFPTSSHVAGTFFISTGTAADPTSAGTGTPITCDPANPCTLWARTIQPQGTEAYVHWDLTFAGMPGAPTGVGASAGDGSTSVSFTAPTNTGNAPITSYTATATPQGGGSPVSQSGAGSPIAIGSLANGTTYDVTVTATNTASDGTTHFTSDPSSPAVPVTPAAPPPAVTSVSPTSGPTAGGNNVTITGTGLSGATSVTFGGTAATIGTNTATQIVATGPAHAAGLVDVIVTNANGSSANTPADNYTYVAPAAPAVTSVSPTSGPTAGGNNVTITGTGLSGATSVTFGGTAATIGTNTATQIVVTAPAHAAGLVDISVTNANGSSANTAADNYTFVAPAPPAVTSVSPTSGPTAGGNNVTINGTGLSGATGVSFGGTPAASITTNTATQIVVVAPAHAAGLVDVRVTNANGTSPNTAADNYTFVAPAPPAVTSVSPTSGPTAGGNNVTINGTGLSGATGVSFGGTPAASITTNTATQIVVVAPAHAAGAVDISVTNANGTSTNTAADNYTFVAPAPPAITSITPKTGPPAGGTVVTINGTGLSGATSVTFGGVAGTITSNTATQIKVTSPAHAAGVVDIVVTTPIGSSANTAADNFTYQEPASDPVGGLLGALIAAVVAVVNGVVCALNPAGAGC